MSPSCYVVARKVKGGIRYHVRYRLGGRETRPLHGGSFPTLREARSRRDWIAGELAAMRVPDLTALTPAAPAVTVAEALDAYAVARTDVGGSAQATYRQARKSLGRLGALPAVDVSPEDVRVWVATMTRDGKKPKTVATYLGVLRSGLDFARVTPNPARDRFVKVPWVQEEELSPPSYREFLALVDAVLPRHRPAVLILERTGLRVGELAKLGWEDVDFAGQRLRIGRGRTKGGTAGRRFVPLLPETASLLEGLRPLEDRVGPVLQGFSAQTLRGAMGRACRHAGMPAYSPHDLRHRYTSLLVLAGVPITLVRQVVGHTRASVTLDTYSHVLLDEPRERLSGLRRGVSVVSGLTGSEARTNDLPAHLGGDGGVEDSGLPYAEG